MWSLVVMIYLINTTAGGGASSNVVTVGQYQTEESCKAAGDKIGEALITLSYLCTGYKYDHDGALQVAARLFAARAASDLITFFKLNGQITTTLISATLTNPQQATIRLIVVAQGTWVLRL